MGRIATDEYALVEPHLHARGTQRLRSAARSSTSIEPGSPANLFAVFESPSDIDSTTDIKLIRIAVLHFSSLGIAVKGVGSHEARWPIKFQMQLDLLFFVEEASFRRYTGREYDDEQEGE
jgi:hypothetical protein